MKLKSLVLPVLVTTFMAVNAFAADNVAKVVIMRGMVKAKLADGSLVDVKVDQSIPEGATVQTADKSFVKLLFIDKSQMNLGPNSQMIINAFPKKEAGIITLVKGQIRSQVTKDYMEMDDKSKSKLYIKTKTAAMGIRGTDFQVNFNAENQNTSLITFEGKVAMAHIGKEARENKFDQGSLEKVVSSDKAVMVTHGQISAVNLNVAERAMEPTKLGTKQIEALESNETGIKESSPAQESAKQFRNPIPPGAEGAAFSSSASELDKEIAKMGVDIKPSAMAEKGSSAEGFFNVSTGEYKLPAGSIVDLNTVNIIPPPTNAVFDANSGTYVVPETFGKIDKVTGEYKAPPGLQLGVDGKFVVVDAEAYKNAQAQTTGAGEAEKSDSKAEEKKSDEKKSDEKAEEKSGDKKDAVSADAPKAEEVAKTDNKGEASRAPASVAPATVEVKTPDIFAGGAAQTFINTFAAPVVKPAVTAAPAATTAARTTLSTLATDVLQKNDTAKQTATDRGVTLPTTSKVKFIFNTDAN